MSLLTIIWNASPEIVSIGPLTLRWYGMFFAVGFILGLWMARRMFEADRAPEAWLDKAFITIVIGTVLGARLGHVFFYEWDYYSQHPAEILQVWRGGLASHGGAIVIPIALWIYSRTVTHRSALWIFDKAAVPTAFVGCLIRLGNLMNSEIVGLPTDVPWAFHFVNAREPFNDVPRHPVQLYEALSYLLSFGILYWAYWHTDKRTKPGYIFGLFLVLIFGFRMIWEAFKTDQGGFGNDIGNALTTGQWLSIPFVLIGLYYMLRRVERRPTAIV